MSEEIYTATDEVPAPLRSALDHVATDAIDTLRLAQIVGQQAAALYEKKYAELQLASIVPLSPEMGLFKDSYEYAVYDHYGQIVAASHYMTNYPLVGKSARRYAIPFQPFGNAFGYHDMDLRKAAEAGGILPPNALGDAELARRYHADMLDTVLLSGVPARRTFGLANNPNVTLVALPTGVWSGTPAGDDILDDINALLDAQTGLNVPESIRFNQVLMSDEAWKVANRTRVFTTASGSAATALQVAREQNPGVTFTRVRKLKGQGASVSRMIAGNFDREVLEGIVGRFFEILDPTRTGMRTDFPCVSSVAGVHVKLTLGLAYADLDV